MAEQQLATNPSGKFAPERVIKVEKRNYIRILWDRCRYNKTGVFSLIVIILLILIAIFGPVISPYDYETVDYTALYAKPDANHWFGCDDSGRDMATLLIYSLRNALIVGLGAVVVELVIGLIVGSLAGYFGGKIDNILMRVVDIMYGFPTFLFNIILVLVLGRSLFTIFLAIGLTSWAGMARLVRSQVLSIKQSDYIEAGRALGATNWRIISRYIIPNCIGPLIVSISFSIPNAMMAESGMSLIGMGVMPPVPSWGGLLAQGNQYILSAPYRIIFPALSLTITILAFSSLGDALRDAFDPRMKR